MCHKVNTRAAIYMATPKSTRLWCKTTITPSEASLGATGDSATGFAGAGAGGAGGKRSLGTSTLSTS